VLVQGELLVEGSPEVVRRDPRVIEAYLGKPPDEVEAEVQAMVEEAQHHKADDSAPTTTMPVVTDSKPEGEQA
jgi:branched-chain amino acid transport system ATP-binding protein